MVTIKLDKERHLRLTLRGMLEFEKATGVNIFKGFDMSKITLEQTYRLSWACLIHEDKSLTFDKFMDIIDLKNMNKMAEAVVKCITESLPDKEDNKNTDPLAKTNP